MSGMIFFGPGAMTVRANNIANATPFRMVSQKIMVTEKANIIELHGPNQYALAVAGGKKSIDINVETATFSMKALGASFYGQTPAAGGTFPVQDESHPIPVTPFQVTIAPPGGGTFVGDMGVIYANGATAGNVFTRVASAPAVGQYSLNDTTGVYTFASADNVAGAIALISYKYSTVTAASGQSILRANQLLGTSAYSTVDILGSNPVTNGVGLLTLYNVTYASFDMINSDTEKFWIPKLTGKVFTNNAGNPYLWSMPDVN